LCFLYKFHVLFTDSYLLFQVAILPNRIASKASGHVDPDINTIIKVRYQSIDRSLHRVCDKCPGIWRSANLLTTNGDLIMIKHLIRLTFGLGLVAVFSLSTAIAAPVVMTDAQMDQVVAGVGRAGGADGTPQGQTAGAGEAGWGVGPSDGHGLLSAGFCDTCTTFPDDLATNGHSAVLVIVPGPKGIAP
jgi:hypothetical protein